VKILLSISKTVLADFVILFEKNEKIAFLLFQRKNIAITETKLLKKS